ncbi:MAG: hypothetical protein A3B13_00775 [Candidatus Liptonbacteria bacterium RIFCSPLOWO2_01_FULL_45_15]|uniref:Orotidine 5'-phosphate decarboxylase domain-containing protein n=1 Tax=Candidatus Liptonbacteria bacterium RIFCSPLOWO2_01_FULL_45_15 TaxID=1798649 RepID=A0A1G2CJ30_9BACT|nr:MAG: hypothetical protein A3B13_00775 [Candidatus Liptonbacteria bacterium RIFCSPLOWO2_01_FULL_45_15]
MNKPIIPLQKSVVVACDVGGYHELDQLITATATVKGIGGYKIGFRLAIRDLERVTNLVKRHTSKPIIFDGQKFGNDIPEIGIEFARDLASCGVDAVIIFPFAGPVTQRIWTEACLKEGLAVIVGGEMTHQGFLDTDGGYIRNTAPNDIYKLAADMGIRDFVVPGNKPATVQHYRKHIDEVCARTDHKEKCLYAPGFINQGGDVTETGKVAGDNWHAIVGSAIYKQTGMDAMRAAAEKVVAQIQVPAKIAA